MTVGNVLQKKDVSLTEGSIVKGLITFAIPLFLGQLLQQFYNMADAWVVGNFASNDAFAAVSMAGNLTFVIIGLFAGISVGAGVIISRYFGARDEKGLQIAIQSSIFDNRWFVDCTSAFESHEYAGQCHAGGAGLFPHLFWRSFYGDSI